MGVVVSKGGGGGGDLLDAFKEVRKQELVDGRWHSLEAVIIK